MESFGFNENSKPIETIEGALEKNVLDQHPNQKRVLDTAVSSRKGQTNEQSKCVHHTLFAATVILLGHPNPTNRMQEPATQHLHHYANTMHECQRHSRCACDGLFIVTVRGSLRESVCHGRRCEVGTAKGIGSGVFPGQWWDWPKLLNRHPFPDSATSRN